MNFTNELYFENFPLQKTIDKHVTFMLDDDMLRLITTLALIVRLHLICMYTVINLMTSLRYFAPNFGFCSFTPVAK